MQKVEVVERFAGEDLSADFEFVSSIGHSMTDALVTGHYGHSTTCLEEPYCGFNDMVFV